MRVPRVCREEVSHRDAVTAYYEERRSWDFSANSAPLRETFAFQHTRRGSKSLCLVAASGCSKYFASLRQKKELTAEERRAQRIGSSVPAERQLREVIVAPFLKAKTPAASALPLTKHRLHHEWRRAEILSGWPLRSRNTTCRAEVGFGWQTMLLPLFGRTDRGLSP